MMNRIFLAAACLCAPLVSHAAIATFLSDLSTSMPLLRDPAFADATAKYVESQVAGMHPGDELVFRTFGMPDDPRNLKTLRIKLDDRQNSPALAAGKAGKLIAGLQSLRDAGQGGTQLVGWLQTYGPSLNCRDGDHLYVLTDAIESSPQTDASALLGGKAALPRIKLDLEGCRVTFYGLGALRPGSQVQALRRAWTEWMEPTGAAFTAITP